MGCQYCHREDVELNRIGICEDCFLKMNIFPFLPWKLEEESD